MVIRHLSHVTCLLTLLALLSACAPGALAISPTPEASPTAQPTRTPTLTPAPRSAQVAEAVNEVNARASSAAAWAAAAVGQRIAAGGGVRTGEASQARVDLSDQTILRLAQNTEFTLTEFTPEAADAVTRLALAAGKLWTFVASGLGQGAFAVETPSGIATVRGTWMSTAFFAANGHFILSCLEGLCRLTGVSGAFTDLVTGQQAEIPSFGEDPSPAQPIDPAQLADWAQNVPEAQAFVATLTPGPPPTDTPTPTPTPTSTPTRTPQELLATFPLQPAEAPAGTVFVEASSGARDQSTYRQLFGVEIPLTRALALGFQYGHVTTFDPAQPQCERWCALVSAVAKFETAEGASEYVRAAVGAFGSYAPVEGLGDEASVWVYQVREGARLDFFTYWWRSGDVVLNLQARTAADTVTQADMRALADIMQAHIP